MKKRKNNDEVKQQRYILNKDIGGGELKKPWNITEGILPIIRGTSARDETQKTSL